MSIYIFGWECINKLPAIYTPSQKFNTIKIQVLRDIIRI